LTPVTSDGSRSGVNWMREKEQSSERASALASIVFPTPGKSSMIRCPSLTRHRTQRRSVSAGAWMTFARLSASRRTTSADSARAVEAGCARLGREADEDLTVRTLLGELTENVHGRLELDPP